MLNWKGRTAKRVENFILWIQIVINKQEIQKTRFRQRQIPLIMQGKVFDFNNELTKITIMIGRMNMRIGGSAMPIINVIIVVQLFFHKREKKYHQSKDGKYIFQFLHESKINYIPYPGINFDD